MISRWNRKTNRKSKCSDQKSRKKFPKELSYIILGFLDNNHVPSRTITYVFCKKSSLITNLPLNLKF